MITPSKFCKNQVVVEAVQLDCRETINEIARWCGAKVCGLGLVWNRAWLEIPTPDGVMRAEYGDWIVKDAAGHFTSCKPDVFEATCEACK